MNGQQKRLEELELIFRQVLNTDTLSLSETSTPDDIPAWDSLNNAVLLAEIQNHFKVRFSLRDIMQIESVGDICSLLEQLDA